MSAAVLRFPSDEAFYRRYVIDHLPDRPTREIIDDLRPRLMLGEEDAVSRNLLFAELAVKAERWLP